MVGIAIMWLLAGSGVAWADPLTLADALQQALDQQPALQGSELSRLQALAQLDAARAGIDPVLTAGASAQTSEMRSFLGGYPVSSSSDGQDADLAVSGSARTGTSWSASANLSHDVTRSEFSLGGLPSEEQVQDIYTTTVGVTLTQDLLAVVRDAPARIAMRQALERLDQAEIALLQARQGAVVEAAEAWWQWSTFTEQAALARRGIAVAEALHEQTRARVEEGVALPMELDQVTAELMAARRDLLTAEASARQAAYTLLASLGRPPSDAVEPDEIGFVRAAQELEPQAQVQRAVEGNLELALARAQLTAAAAAAQDTLDARLPSLDAFGSAGVSTLSDTLAESLRDLRGDAFPNLSAGVELSVPLGGRAARAGVEEARAVQSQAEVSLEALERQVTAQALAAVEDVAIARQSIELAQAQLAAAMRAEDGERARHEEGLSTLNLLLDAIQARDQAELALLQARLDLARAELTLARLQGDAEGALTRAGPASTPIPTPQGP